MRWAFLCCLILAGIHAYLGFHIVRRGVLFVDLAMAQAAALGAAVAVVIGIEHDTVAEYIVSAAFALASAAFFALVRSQRIHKEAVVATFYGLAVAATFIVLEHSPHGMEEVKHLFVGQVLTVAPRHVLATAVVYLLVGIGHALLHRRTTAITEGRSAAAWVEFFFYGSFAIVVTSSVGLVGVLLVFAFLVLPAVAALLISQNDSARLAWGWGMATIASVVGLQVAYHQDLPAAPTIVLILGVFLIASVVLGRVRGG
jgi:zinc/manganese transport system permease protein